MRMKLYNNQKPLLILGIQDIEVLHPMLFEYPARDLVELFEFQ